jgi:hypothetical protein
MVAFDLNSCDFAVDEQVRKNLAINRNIFLLAQGILCWLTTGPALPETSAGGNAGEQDPGGGVTGLCELPDVEQLVEEVWSCGVIERGP